MAKSSASKSAFNLTPALLLVCGIIFFAGYAVSLHLLRSRVVNMTTDHISSEIKAVGNYVDSKLQTVEEILFSSTWAEDRHGTPFYFQDYDYSEDELFSFLEDILSLHPDICGAAFGMDPKQKFYPPQGKYGFAPYVTNIDGEMKRIRLGADEDYSKKDWFRCAAERNDVYWNPFCESSSGKFASSFSLPMRDENGDVCGVFAMDFYLDGLRQQCQDITSPKNDIVTILDENFRFISHPDVSMTLKNAAEYGSELWDSMIEKSRDDFEPGMVYGKKEGEDYVLYFFHVERTGWLICVECPMNEIFGSVDKLRFQTTVISILSLLMIVLCITFLYVKMRRALLAKVAFETDIKIAGELQMGMLPKKQPAFPERKDMDIFGFLQPAKEVGGDLYDYILKDDRLVFCIGDVSGKGVPAALFMSIVVTYFHNRAKKIYGAEQIVTSLNELLASQSSENMFCTFFLGILNLRNGRLDYCSAGHDAPIIIRKTAAGYEADFVKAKQNLVLGAIDDIEYEEGHTTMRPGDGLFLYTDGVTEAENSDKELFGVDATLDGIRKVFNSNGLAPTHEKVKMMLDEIHRHTKGNLQSDDITMLMVEYKGTTINLENKIEQLSLLSDFVKDMCGQYSISEDIVNDIDVSLDEIGTNIISYAFPPDEAHNFYVSFHYEAGEVVFTFEDDGIPFDPTQPTDSHLDLPPEERPVGGLGIMMVKALMDKVEYERRDDKNIVCIVKKIE